MPPEIVEPISTFLAGSQQDDLNARVAKIAETIGVENVKNVVISDNPLIWARWHTDYSRSKDAPDEMEVTRAFVDALTQRQQNALIAHEMFHKDDFAHKRNRHVGGSDKEEISADDRSIRAWGDPEALREALRKSEEYNNNLPQPRDYINVYYDILKDAAGTDNKRVEKLKTEEQAALQKYDAADDKGRLDMLHEIRLHFDDFNKGKKHLYPDPIERDAHIKAVELDMMQEAATGLVNPKATAQSIQVNLARLLKMAGRDGEKLELTAEQAKALGEKLLAEIPLVRNGQAGHDIKDIDALLPLAQKDRASLHPQMQKALAEYAAGGQAQGNYLPMNKTLPQGKTITMT